MGTGGHSFRRLRTLLISSLASLPLDSLPKTGRGTISLHKNLLHDISEHIRQAEMAALMEIGEARVV